MYGQRPWQTEPLSRFKMGRPPTTKMFFPSDRLLGFANAFLIAVAFIHHSKKPKFHKKWVWWYFNITRANFR